MVTLQQFMNAWQGKKVPSRGGITGQCVSLVQHWAEDQGIGGTPVFPVPSAYLMAGKRPDAFTWVANTPTGVPSPGDIVVFGNKVGGGHGHTGIVVSANKNSLDVFQQNDPMGSGAYTKRYTYANVVGWLKFKQAAPAAPQGDIMITENDRDPIRVISSEVKGWDFDAVHRGTWDAREVGAWKGRPWHDFVMQAWNEGAAFRQARNQKMRDYDVLAAQVAQLKQNPTKAELEAVVNQLKASAEKVTELEKKVAEEQAKRTEDTIMVDEAAKSVNFIKRFLAWLDKRGQK